MNPDEIKRSILDFIFSGEYQKAKDYIDILIEMQTESNPLYGE